MDIMKLKVKEGIVGMDAVPTSDFWYDVFLGGYFEPEELLDEESAKKVREAMNTIQEYQSLLEYNGLLVEM